MTRSAAGRFDGARRAGASPAVRWDREDCLYRQIDNDNTSPQAHSAGKADRRVRTSWGSPEPDNRTAAICPGSGSSGQSYNRRRAVRRKGNRRGISHWDALCLVGADGRNDGIGLIAISRSGDAIVINDAFGP